MTALVGLLHDSCNSSCTEDFIKLSSHDSGGNILIVLEGPEREIIVKRQDLINAIKYIKE